MWGEDVASYLQYTLTAFAEQVDFEENLRNITEHGR